MEIQNDTPADAAIESPVIANELERMLADVDKELANGGAETKEATTEEVATETDEVEPVETGDTGTELAPDTRSSDKTEVAKPSEEEKSLARIATKEKEVRELTSKFEAERKAFEAERRGLVKPADMKDNPTAVLKAAGLDPELVMKQILFEKLPDDSPVKAKLKSELSEYHRDKQIADLRREIEAKDNAAAQQRQYQETISTIEKYTETFKEDNKELPNLSRIGKKDPGYLKDLIVQEIVDDVRHRYITGEGGDPIDHTEAARRVNARIAKLATFLSDSKTEVKKPAGTVTTKKTIPGNPTAKDAKPQTIKGAVDDLINSTIAEFNKSEVKQGRR